ncbi:hypothetical protein FKW77_001563 [Venturia effusa]|uniref:Uncharacterized protein n=1 Tax=Venturia effusa TaxID=50376 RepID=A0A517LEU1_9PEZI|nr:hypothetical protein FKW77_001563 [Venturia effusa]
MKSTVTLFFIVSPVCALPQLRRDQAAASAPGSTIPASVAEFVSPPSLAAGSSTVTPGKPQCEYSMFEKANLEHNHDVNTGKIKGGSTVVPYAPAILGSGCSPAWAVGGAIDDDTPTKTPQDMKLSLWGGVA